MNIQPKSRSDCNKHIVKREHYSRKNGIWKPKKQFKSQQDAEYWINKYKMYGYSTYICKVCGGWHIGLRKQKE